MQKRKAYLIGESAANDARLIKSRELGGYGLDAQWNDDFHHSLHVLLTGEQAGYYQDFGRLHHLVKAFREGFVYSGEYSPYRRRRHGVSSKDIPSHRFVVFSQNHDQVGNRAQGERLSRIVSFEALKLAAGTVLLSPYIPLIFMGEEYGETAPFPYFVSHAEPELIEAVRKGRREEFAAFRWQGEIPDPQDEKTFTSARINRNLRDQGQHCVLLEFYKELIRLRKVTPALANLSKDTLEIKADEENKAIIMHRWKDNSEVIAVFNFADGGVSIRLTVPVGQWRKYLDSAEERWQGSGSTIPDLISPSEGSLNIAPESFVLFLKES